MTAQQFASLAHWARVAEAGGDAVAREAKRLHSILMRMDFQFDLDVMNLAYDDLMLEFHELQTHIGYLEEMVDKIRKDANAHE